MLQIRNNFWCAAVFFFMITSCFDPKTLWAHTTTIPILKITLSQERSVKEGVLSVRPNQTDVLLLSLIRQNEIYSIDDYAQWLETHMTYQAMPFTRSWPDPLNFLRTRHGDCKNFAAFNYQILKIFGFHPHILALRTSHSGHAVCVFEFSGKYYWFDNASLKNSSAHNILELSQELIESLHYTQSSEIDWETKRESLIFQQS